MASKQGQECNWCGVSKKSTEAAVGVQEKVKGDDDEKGEKKEESSRPQRSTPADLSSEKVMHVAARRCSMQAGSSTPLGTTNHTKRFNIWQRDSRSGG